jgi:hypothetical protein
MKRKYMLAFPFTGILTLFVLGFSQIGSQSSIPASAEADTLNIAPILYDYELETTQNIPVGGTLRFYDQENDAISITVVTPPEKGEVIFDGLSFTYTPFLGESGEDTFSCIAKDAAGNESQPNTVSLTIEESETQFSYADMKQNPSHYSAIKLYENDLIHGETVGSIRLFHPESELTRGDFMLWILSVLEIDDKVKPCVNTGLQNDTDIPLWMKPYVQLAISQNIILEDNWKPDEILTNAEAVLMIDRAAQIKDVRGYLLSVSDTGEIPNWALQSYLNLGAYRMLDCYDGAAHPNDALTRDTAADLVWQLYKYNQKFHITG